MYGQNGQNGQPVTSLAMVVGIGDGDTVPTLLHFVGDEAVMVIHKKKFLVINIPAQVNNSPPFHYTFLQRFHFEGNFLLKENLRFWKEKRKKNKIKMENIRS